MRTLWVFVLGPLACGLRAQTHEAFLETLRSLSMEQHPEWTNSDVDSAHAIWIQWTVLGAPREATSLCFIAAHQQFQLEIYQSQFGWPRDSTEWRAIPLSVEQREALQFLYHGMKTASGGRIAVGPIDPSFNLGWSCSGCTQSNWHRGTALGLYNPSASAMAHPWSSPVWSVRSPVDLPVRMWASPHSFALGIRPRFTPNGTFSYPKSARNSYGPSGSQFNARGFGTVENGITKFGEWPPPVHRTRSFGRNMIHRIDQAVIGLDSSGIWFVDLSVRSTYAKFKVGISSQGWAELSGSWYGPGGLLISVQREWVPTECKLGREGRPAAGATPWRPLRGNRATAAMPLWAGRLSIQKTTTGPSAIWADRSRSAVWYPGQISLGFRSEKALLNRAVPISIRSHLYLGTAQGASFQLRCALTPLTVELGLASITAREGHPHSFARLIDASQITQPTKNPESIYFETTPTQGFVLPRATGPMNLWRPGWTAEAGLTHTSKRARSSGRIRRSPSGWSGSIRTQLLL